MPDERNENFYSSPCLPGATRERVLKENDLFGVRDLPFRPFPVRRRRPRNNEKGDRRDKGDFGRGRATEARKTRNHVTREKVTAVRDGDLMFGKRVPSAERKRRRGRGDMALSETESTPSLFASRKRIYAGRSAFIESL